MQRLSEEFCFSQRHACELMGIPRTCCRYQSRRDDRSLQERLLELARDKPRYRYRTPEEFAALRAAGQSSAGPGEGISNADPFPRPPSRLNQRWLEPGCECRIRFNWAEFASKRGRHRFCAI